MFLSLLEVSVSWRWVQWVRDEWLDCSMQYVYSDYEYEGVEVEIEVRNADPPELKVWKVSNVCALGT